MGKRGKAATPVEIAIRRGTYRESRHGKKPSKTNGPDYLTAVPFPPDHFDEFAAKVWTNYLNNAVKLKLITTQDLPLLEQYCIACQNARDYSQAPKTEIDDKGMSRPSAAHRIWKDSIDVMIRLSPRFGVDPSSRTSLNVRTSQEDEVKQLTGLSL
jgi:P27 family predicted phage terminase small subunit